MINWNDLKHLDVKNVDLTTIDLSRFDVRNLDLPFEMPDVELPKFDMPDTGIEDVERLAGLARDAAYAGFGVAVVTAQRLDDQRRDLTDQVATKVRKFVDAIA